MNTYINLVKNKRSVKRESIVNKIDDKYLVSIINERKSTNNSDNLITNKPVEDNQPIINNTANISEINNSTIFKKRKFAEINQQSTIQNAEINNISNLAVNKIPDKNPLLIKQPAQQTLSNSININNPNKTSIIPNKFSLGSIHSFQIKDSFLRK
jgi:hypothetical protein